MFIGASIGSAPGRHASAARTIPPCASERLPLDKELSRQVNVDGADYTIAIDPAGLRVTGKGRRKPQAELRWQDLLHGEAALATALNASLLMTGPLAARNMVKPHAALPSAPSRKQAPKKRAALTATSSPDAGEWDVPTTQRMCGVCHARIYNTNSARLGVVVVRAGALDRSDELEAAAHIWVKRKQPWLALADETPAQEEGAPLQELLQALAPR